MEDGYLVAGEHKLLEIIGANCIAEIWRNAIEIAAKQKNSETNQKICKMLEKGFAMQETVTTGGILFIGLNPSVVVKDSDDREKLDSKGITIEKYSGIQCTFYRKNSYENYFGVLKNICDKLTKTSEEKNWHYSHLDMFYLHHTSQELVEQMINSGEYDTFFIRQFEFTKAAILAIKPQAIVVANAFASRLLSNSINDIDKDSDKLTYKSEKEKVDSLLIDHMSDLSQEWNNEIGTYVIKGGELDGTPVFYSGMLSGGRALDVGSRQRLVWQLTKALEWKQNNSNNKQNTEK